MSCLSKSGVSTIATIAKFMNTSVTRHAPHARITSQLYQKHNYKPKIQAMPLVTINSSIIDSLKKSKVIPDVIDEFHPSTFLQVHWTDDIQAQLGNNLAVNDTQDKPTILLTPEQQELDNEETYTLCMTDPDAPKPEDPKNSEFCHWLVTDLKAIVGEPVDISKGKELIEYMGPAPPAKTGYHRYVLLVFVNPKNGKELEKPADRGKWGYDSDKRIGARHYAEKYGLKLVGANFFNAKNEKQ